MKNAMTHFGPVISEIVGRRVNVLAAENDRTFGHLQEPTSIMIRGTVYRPTGVSCYPTKINDYTNSNMEK